MPPGQKPAGGGYILPARRPYGADDAGEGKARTESLHVDVRGSLVWKIRDPMETYEVYPALDSPEGPCKSVGMTDVVVESLEHGVLETDPALKAEIVSANKGEHLFQRIGILDRHYPGPLFRKWIMETYGKMAAGVPDEVGQLREDSYGGNRNPLGTPAKTPVGCQDFDGAHHGGVIVKGLAHAHKNGIGNIPSLIDSKELREDVGGGKMAVKALPARHAEFAAHLAAGLRRNAKRTAVSVGNHHGLDHAALRGGILPLAEGAGYGEKIFSGSVGGRERLRRKSHPHREPFFEARAAFLGDIRHPGYASDALPVEPARHLPSGIRRKAARECNFLEFRGSHPQKHSFIHTKIYLHKKAFTCLQKYLKKSDLFYIFVVHGIL